MCQRSQCGVSILIPSSGIFFHLCRQNLSIPLIYDVGHHIKCESESGPLFDTSARFPLGGEVGGRAGSSTVPLSSLGGWKCSLHTLSVTAATSQ